MMRPNNGRWSLAMLLLLCSSFVYSQNTKPIIVVPHCGHYPLRSTTVGLYHDTATQQIDITGTAAEKIYRVVINDSMGRNIYTRQFDADSIAIDISRLSKGIYVATVNGKAQRIFAKQ